MHKLAMFKMQVYGRISDKKKNTETRLRIDKMCIVQMNNCYIFFSSDINKTIFISIGNKLASDSISEA